MSKLESDLTNKNKPELVSKPPTAPVPSEMVSGNVSTTALTTTAKTQSTTDDGIVGLLKFVLIVLGVNAIWEKLKPK